MRGERGGVGGGGSGQRQFGPKGAVYGGAAPRAQLLPIRAGRQDDDCAVDRCQRAGKEVKHRELHRKETPRWQTGVHPAALCRGIARRSGQQWQGATRWNEP